MADQVSTEEIVKELREQVRGKPQDPNGVKVEASGDAPELVQFAGGDSQCCAPRAGVPGVEVSLMVSYRGHAGYPVTAVYVWWLEADGSIPDPHQHYDWTLTKAEQHQSEKGSVSHTFKPCVPCEAFTNEGTARFRIRAMCSCYSDSYQIVGIAVPEAVFKRCCPKFQMHRVRPPKG
jgi:hypothetical protein